MNSPCRRRCAVAVAAFCLICGIWPLAHGARTVAYRVKIHTLTWIPIRSSDLAFSLRSKVLSVLAPDSALKFVPAGKAVTAEYELKVVGEIVEDAGDFSVVLGLNPHSDASLPSFVAAATTSISRREKGAIFRKILQAARQAAQRLRKRMRRGFDGRGAVWRASASPGVADWGRIRPPRVNAKSGDLAVFLNTRLSNDRRLEAGKRLSARAYDEATVRHAFEHVALTDPQPLMRYYALRFLRPSSRRHRLTQRIILGVLREDADPKVRAEAFELSEAFVGLALTETLDTWVSLLPSKIAAFGPRPFSRLVKLLSARAAKVPNLEAGLLKCLLQREVLRGGKRRRAQCMEIVEALPAPRRQAVLIRYLDRPVRELRGELPRERYDSGPIPAALRLLRRQKCLSPQLVTVLLRHVQSEVTPLYKRGIVEALVNAAPSSAALRFFEQLLRESEDERLRRLAIDGLRAAARSNRVPWGIPHAKRVRAIAGRSQSAGRLSDLERRSLERLIERIAKAARPAHRLALRAQLRSGRPPKPAVVDHFARCARSGQARVRRDCISGLLWLAGDFPGLRASAQREIRKLVQSDASPRSWTRRRLESALKPEPPTTYELGCVPY